jgi:hypothetical protein
MGVLADAKVLFEVLNAAGEWLRKALNQARAKRDRRAARVLHDAFVVVASMRANDNAFRPLLGQLLGFSIEWEVDRRRQLSQELRSFFDIEEILPRFRQAFQALQASAWEGAGHEALGRLIGGATAFAGDIVGPIWKEKENYIVRERMLNALSYGRSDDDTKTVREWAERVAAILDRQLLAETDNAFGELRHAILTAHDLPDPGYAIALN